MKCKAIIVLALFFLFGIVGAQALEPSRTKGIWFHMLPERVAVMMHKSGGFTVSYRSYLKGEKDPPVLRDAKELFAYISKQDKEVQADGVWIITTHPDAYTDEEKQKLQEVKDLLLKNNIPLFMCRGSELPNGWRKIETGDPYPFD